MKKRLLSATMALVLSIVCFEAFTAKTANAQCGCSCSVSGNTCDFSCSDCGLLEFIRVAIACCEGAR